MVRFTKSLLCMGLFMSVGLVAGCSGSDTGASSQTKKDSAPGMKMMAEKQAEMAKKHGQPGGAPAEEEDKDKAKSDEKKDEKKADEKSNKDKQ
jgi:hypothetical protein